MLLPTSKDINEVPAIELSHVHFSYPETPVLKDISFQIYPVN